jgi:hypothetical protein
MHGSENVKFKAGVYKYQAPGRQGA